MASAVKRLTADFSRAPVTGRSASHDVAPAIALAPAVGWPPGRAELRGDGDAVSSTMVPRVMEMRCFLFGGVDMLFAGGARLRRAGGGDPDHDFSKAETGEVSSLLLSRSAPAGTSVAAPWAGTAEMVCVDDCWRGAGACCTGEAGRPARADLDCKDGRGAANTL